LYSHRSHRYEEKMGEDAADIIARERQEAREQRAKEEREANEVATITKDGWTTLRKTIRVAAKMAKRASTIGEDEEDEEEGKKGDEEEEEDEDEEDDVASPLGGRSMKKSFKMARQNSKIKHNE
jgi:hypothetical protein